MTLIGLLVTIAILGLIVWAIEQIPMPPPFAAVIRIIAVIILILILLQFLGYPYGPLLMRRC